LVLKITVHVDQELQEYIPMFLENRKKEVSLLSELLKKKDFEQIRMLGHGMKGFGSGYGFDFITTIGKELEGAARNRDVGSIGRLIQDYAKYLNQVEVVFSPQEVDDEESE
jgi:HPt (histidine-containing phosphotransfer) domain-containing protein